MNKVKKEISSRDMSVQCFRFLYHIAYVLLSAHILIACLLKAHLLEKYYNAGNKVVSDLLQNLRTVST